MTAGGEDVGERERTAVLDDVAMPVHVYDDLHRLLEPGLVRLPFAQRLAELLCRTRDICRVDTTAVLLVEADGSLAVRSAVGVGAEDLGGVRLAPGEGLAGRAAERRAMVVVEDRAALVTISERLAERGASVAAAVPLVVDDDVTGVLVVSSRTPRALERAEILALELAAERLALAVEHERITDLGRVRHEATSEIATRYRALHELAGALAAAVTPREVVDVTLEHGLRALDATDGVVALVREGALHVEGSTYDAGLMSGWESFPLAAPVPMAIAAREGRGVYTPTRDEVLRDFPDIAPFLRSGRSTAALPLTAGGTTLGSIALIFASERDFAGPDRELLETVAQQCAQAMSRAQLYEAERQATGRLRFLAEASALLQSSLDYETTLRSLADAVVPYLADWCAVDMASGNGLVRRLAVAHVDPEKVALARDLHDRMPFDPDADTGVARALRTGEVEVLPEISDELIDATVPDADLRQVIKALQLRSAVIVPLRARGRVLGALTLVMAESGRRYGAEDVALAEELARMAGVAVDNAQLFDERSEVARALQSSLLPPVLPRIPRLEVAARYLPSGSHAEVGGDFYDVFRDVDGQWALVIGDVCGKGPEAAGVTGLARHTVRAMAQHDPAPGAVLEAVNVALLDQVPLGRFCTIGYARFDVDSPEVTVTVASGGHPLPLVRRPSGLVEAVGRPGMLVGVTRPAVCPEDVVVLRPGDALLLYTDGLVERHQAAGGVEDGEPALRAVLSRCDGLDADRIADLILSVSFDQPHSARDDVALLVVRVVD